MKKLLFVGILIIIMAVTNPSKIEYLDWAKEQLIEQSTYGLVDLGIELFAPKLLEGSTKVDNYVIFSIFKTKVMDTTVTTVGLFENFLPLPNKNNSSNQAITTPEDEPVQVFVENPAKEDTSAASKSDDTTETGDYSSVPFIRNTNDKPLNKTIIWKGELEDKSLNIELKDGRAELVIGLGHPNGIEINVYHKDTRWDLDWSKGENPVYEFGTPESESYAVQGTTYDFDNDGSDEIIISIGEGLAERQMWIFKYYETIRSDINPYKLLLTQDFQQKVYIEDNKVTIPYGSQGLFDEYAFFEGNFYEQVY